MRDELHLDAKIITSMSLVTSKKNPRNNLKLLVYQVWIQHAGKMSNLLRENVNIIIIIHQPGGQRKDILLKIIPRRSLAIFYA